MFLLVIFLASFSLTYIVKLIAQKKMLIDIPNERSSHVVPTPRGGGLAIAISWFGGISYLYYLGEIDANLYYALLSGVLISIISFIDDIYTLPYLPRIIVQSISAGLGLYFVGGLNEIDLGFVNVEVPIILNLIAFVGILWFINLFNFIDGINGYSSSGAIFIALALFFFTNDNLLLVLALAVLGFLPWNWGKAKIFMGDIGSTLLGFTIPILLIYYNKTNEFSIINGLIITSVFWFDATYTLIKRYLNKEKLSEPHKKHAYQRIVQYGFSHQKTTLISLLINVLLFGVVLISQRYHVINVISLIVVLLLLSLCYKLVDAKKPFK